MPTSSRDNTKRTRARQTGVLVGVRVQPDLLAAIDTWIVECKHQSVPEELSRPEAIRRLAQEALTTMGLLKPQ